MALLKIDRVAFWIGDHEVAWYGIIFASAILVGLLLALSKKQRDDLDENGLLDIFIIVVVAGLVGARLFHVLFNIREYETLFEAVNVHQGGMAIQGGVIASCLAGYIVIKRKGWSYAKVADVAAAPLILAQAIGRWGNFFNQEAYGTAVERSYLESFYLPNWFIEQMNINGVYHHPNFLYESLWCLLGFGLLIYLRNRANLLPGEVFGSYIIWYSIGRLFIESIRENDVLLLGGVRVAEMISLLAIVGTLVWLIVRRVQFSNN